MFALEEQKGNDRTDDLKQENYDFQHAHEEQKRYLHDQHVRKLQQMNREHERKIKNDNDKFDALLDQKESTMKEWQEKIL